MVVPTFVAECGKCKNCRSGKTNLCLTYPLSASFTGLFPDGSSRMSTNGGQRLYHFLSCSTWSEYTVINIHYIVKIGPRIALPHASFISCGFSTGFGATWKEAKVEKGSTVAVLGLGAVGLGVIAGAQTQGAGRIIGVDTNKKKREKGVAFGMTDFINPRGGDSNITWGRNSYKCRNQLHAPPFGQGDEVFCFWWDKSSVRSPCNSWQMHKQGNR
ncbi:uncharacterized protein LOC114284467 isoform X2 [Camellia sinensis]|uniref:uncharacterized protein LOC114284467 isoform X2 n=1 Tax=Camellia sinensis TaxID=4442 RepID=UPI00103635D9|nr:uncharacterized protein LOC114284467 isoform X2 [Camellia sinensis]